MSGRVWAAALFFAVAAGSCASAERPNVLLLLVDDLKPAIAAYGDPVAQTPHLDRLVARGMRFRKAYCNQAVCAPSRFTLMLGAHSTSTGLYGLGSRLRDVLPDAITMPQYFARCGYRTESLGKVFHIGHGNEGDPESFDVPHFAEKVIEYVDPASTDGGQLTREEAYFTNQQLDRIAELPRGAAFESPDVDDQAYADGRVAAEAVKRLRAAKQRRREEGTPFLMAVGFARPHLPFSVPRKYWELYDADDLPLPHRERLPDQAPAVAGKRGGEISNYKPVPPAGPQSDMLKRQLIHGYYASVSFVDAQIGKVLEELRRLELEEETLIVLWGDHGFHLGDLGLWTKHTNYEQANRIPLVFVAPGVTEPGTVSDQLAESVDVFPTLAELCGLPASELPPSLDGVSLVPVLKNPAHRVRDHAFHAYPKAKLGRAIRTARYRLVEWRRLGSTEPAEYELYDYRDDPLETRNWAADKPEIVRRLSAILATYPAPALRPGGLPPAATPEIANRPLTIRVTVAGEQLDGVVLAQGGNQIGYAVRFAEGRPRFDVRIGKRVTTVALPQPRRGRTSIVAGLDAEKIWLRGAGQYAEKPSPGLLPRQPLDPLSLGRDNRSAVGSYAPPHPLRGEVLEWKVETGRRADRR